MSSPSSSTGGAPNCPRDDDCDTSIVVVAQTGDGGAAPLPDSISPEIERPEDTCPERSQLPPPALLPTKVDWPSDLLYKLLVQSGVPINCGKTMQGISSQSISGSNETFDNNTIDTDPNDLSGVNNFTTRPDDLISAVLEHILPGLKKSTSISTNNTESKDASKIPWDVNRDGYISSTLGEIKDAASARFAVSLNKESSERSKYSVFRLAIVFAHLLCVT